MVQNDFAERYREFELTQAYVLTKHLDDVSLGLRDSRLLIYIFLNFSKLTKW